MKVSREMLHWELQPYFRRASLLKIMMRVKLLTQLVNWLTDRFLAGKDIDGFSCSEKYIASSDGIHQIRTRIYKPSDNDKKLPIMLYCHGGGYIMGNPEQSHMMLKKYLQTRDCIIVAPSYRKSYKQPFPAGFKDCYDALLWAKENAEELGGDADKIIVAGHSGGGGLTAAVTLKARDTGDVKIAFQMPIYPMIDDKQPVDSARYINTPVWDSHTNAVGWNAYLSGLKKSKNEIPAYAAPARNSDYSNFPPTLTYVGSLDPFYQETCAYVAALKEANVDVAFEEYDGCFHGFEVLFPKTNIAKQALQFSLDQYANFYDRYVT